jgi:hypothetical protein
LDDLRKNWSDRVYRSSRSVNSRHVAEMAVRAFERFFGEPTEAIIEKVKRKKLDACSLFDIQTVLPSGKMVIRK